MKGKDFGPGMVSKGLQLGTLLSSLKGFTGQLKHLFVSSLCDVKRLLIVFFAIFIVHSVAFESPAETNSFISIS